MISCKKASELQTKEQNGHPLSKTERIMLKFHMVVCVVCRKYSKQLEFINETCRNYFRAIEKFSPDTKKCMSPECKQRMQNQINKENH